MADAAAQWEQDVRAVEVQVTVDSQANSAQTEGFPAETAEAAVQANGRRATKTLETQTMDIEPEAPVVETKVVEVEVQTEQAPVKATSSKAVQAAQRPPTQLTQGLQTDPWEDQALFEKLRLRVATSDAAVEVLGLENAELKTTERTLQDDLRNSQQLVATWQKAAKSKVFGHLNVLVVSPKAECTVRGQNIEMASWDTSRIQSMIEEEVIPRFTRVFAYESEEQPPEVQNAIDLAMKDFASTFRTKLSEMLTTAGHKAARS